MKNDLQPLCCLCRRQRGDLTEVYKIINKICDIKVIFNLSNNNGTRGHAYKMVKQRNHPDIQKCYTFLHMGLSRVKIEGLAMHTSKKNCFFD